MKRLVTIAAYLMVVVLVGVSTLKSAEQPGSMKGQATVRTIKGKATYTKPGESPKPLTVNKVLDVGDTITTEADSYVYVSVNGISSAVRVAAETTLVLKDMSHIGSYRQGTTETALDLRVGSIQGQVKKVQGDSKYEISTPHGVAGIRGTDFAVDVIANGNGTYTVTFTSLTGTVVASAVVNGQLQTKTLSGGESWTVGGDVVPVEIKLLDYELNLINQLIAGINLGTGPIQIGPIQVRPQPGGGSASD